MQSAARSNVQLSHVDEYPSFFQEHGYLVLPRIVPAAPLERLSAELCAEFARAKRAGELFSGGGTISGHLNCFPGAQSRFVYDTLNDAGVFELVRRLSPQAVRLPNIGCNLNLPSSSAQNHHIDGYASTPFMITNVAAVKTTVHNGAIQLSPGSHKHDYKYWQFVVARHRTVRVEMNPGDVLLRPSSLWHRGMSNRSDEVRPMLGFSWEDGGSSLADPYSIHAGEITLLPNRYRQDYVGQLRERAFAALPLLGASYLFVRSLRP
jgi:hypothetical protein